MENHLKFKQETVIITNIFMSTEDIGGDEDVKVGTIGVVFHEPYDEEDSVGVIMNNSRYYISQHAIEPFKTEEEQEDVEDLFERIDELPLAVQLILTKYQDKEGYNSCYLMLEELKPHGYAFEYGLDAQPYNLRKIEQEKALKTPTELKEKWMNKLEESKTQPRKFQPHDTAWDFVEEYYPNYSSADNICRALDLFLKKEQNGDTLSDKEDEELTYIMEDVYQSAINAFIQSQNK